LTVSELPTKVIETDRKLQQSADQLMQLRWHWTLDKSNPDRVSIADYARGVGVARPRVSIDANAWADYLDSRTPRRTGTVDSPPGAPQTPDDFRRLKSLTEEQRVAAQAIASATGTSPGNVAHNKREEVAAVVNTARERAVDRGTTVEHEIERAAQWREKTRKAAQREQDEKRKRSTMRFIEIEGHIGAAMQRLRKVLDLAEDGFTDEERELVAASLNKMRALLNLIDLRITGDTEIDWDVEFEKLVK